MHAVAAVKAARAAAAALHNLAAFGLLRDGFWKGRKKDRLDVVASW